MKLWAAHLAMAISNPSFSGTRCIRSTERMVG